MMRLQSCHTQENVKDMNNPLRWRGAEKEPIVRPAGGKEFPWPVTNKSYSPCNREREAWKGGRR